MAARSTLPWVLVVVCACVPTTGARLASSDTRAGEGDATDGSGLTCAQRVADLDAYLIALQRAGATPSALRAPVSTSTDASASASVNDPAARAGALDTPAVVELATDRFTVAVPGALAVHVAPERVLVAGEQILTHRAADPHELILLRRRLRDQACGHASHAYKAVLYIDPETSWRRVRTVIREADNAGVDRVYLVFRAPHGVVAPDSRTLAAVRGRSLEQVYAGCRGLAAAVAQVAQVAQVALKQHGRAGAENPAEVDGSAHASYRGALTRAISACRCRVDFDAAKAFHYQDGGLTETHGRMAVAVLMPLVDAHAQLGDQRQTIAIAPETPWSQAHAMVLRALRDKKPAYLPIERGERIAINLLDAGTDYHREVCSIVRDRINQKAGLLSDAAADAAGNPRPEPRNVDAGGTWQPVGSGDGGGAGGEAGDEVGDEAKVTGGLDKAIVRHYVQLASERIRYCYVKERRRKPELQGKLVVSFQIGPDGRVSSVSARGVHADVASCVARTIQSIQFPRAKDGGLVDVQYPFVFRPSH